MPCTQLDRRRECPLKSPDLNAPKSSSASRHIPPTPAGRNTRRQQPRDRLATASERRRANTDVFGTDLKTTTERIETEHVHREVHPVGLNPGDPRNFAINLARAGIDYISVMGGTYESFLLPDILEKSRQEGYMLDLAADIRAVVDVPVIAAGRFATGAFADRAISDKKTDLIGLARVLWADPQWPKKVRDGREADIIHCDPDCVDGGACMQMVMKGRPAFCVAWPAEKMKAWKAKFV